MSECTYNQGSIAKGWKPSHSDSWQFFKVTVVQRGNDNIRKLPQSTRKVKDGFPTHRPIIAKALIHKHTRITTATLISKEHSGRIIKTHHKFSQTEARYECHKWTPATEEQYGLYRYFFTGYVKKIIISELARPHSRRYWWRISWSSDLVGELHISSPRYLWLLT